MSKVLVTTNSNPSLFIEVDLSSSEWKSLHQDNLPPFKMEELQRPCSAYPDGIFPGAEKYDSDKQISRITKFPNYIEFCKVMSEDALPVNNKLYLTTRFYDQRKMGWTSNNLLKKEGEVIGYCLNGDVYSSEDLDQVYNIFYRVVYYSLACKLPAFIKLQDFLKEGICLQLTGADETFLNWLAKVLVQDKS